MGRLSPLAKRVRLKNRVRAGLGSPLPRCFGRGAGGEGALAFSPGRSSILGRSHRRCGDNFGSPAAQSKLTTNAAPTNAAPQHPAPLLLCKAPLLLPPFQPHTALRRLALANPTHERVDFAADGADLFPDIVV